MYKYPVAILNKKTTITMIAIKHENNLQIIEPTVEQLNPEALI